MKILVIATDNPYNSGDRNNFLNENNLNDATHFPIFISNKYAKKQTIKLSHSQGLASK